ncbi:MAG: PD-(D/E)XK nuclease family protein [Actinomycetota bacterium]|nr:PD-(D/E)XK nuclease family protein [Actinomycetota bacterium]
MTGTVLWLSSAREATVALADVVRNAQGEDPLAAVSVVAPSAYAALWLRRELPRRCPGGRGGLANVRFGTLDELAATAAGPVLAARGVAEADPTVLYAVLRSVVSPGERSHVPPVGGPVRSAPNRPGGTPDPVLPWGDAELASNPRTQRLLMGAVQILGGLTSAGRQQLAGFDPACRPMLAAFDEWRRRLEEQGLYERSGLYRAATEAVEQGALADRQVVVHLPAELAPMQERLVTALTRSTRCSLLVALTGDAVCDAEPRRRGREWSGGIRTHRAAPVGDASPDPCHERTGAIFEAPDPDVEVSEVVAQISKQLSNGVAAHRMAVALPPNGPYERLVTERLRTAGIPFASRNPRRLAESFAGRCVLGALELAAGDLRRDSVSDFLARIPVVRGDRRAPTAAWERLSRQAGVVSGVQQWDSRLSALVRELSGRSPATADHAARLRELILEMWPLLLTIRGAGTWATLSATVGSFVKLLLGGARHREEWPESERRSAEVVEAALARLGRLDGLDPGPSTRRFADAVAIELRQRQLHTGSLGEGITVASRNSLLGMDFDATFVMGASRSSLPAATAGNPFLSRLSAFRSARAGTGCADYDAMWARYHYLCCLDATKVSVRTYSRGTLGNGVGDGPSPWLEAGRIERRAAAGSFAEWLTAAEPVPAPHEHLASIWAWRESGNALEDHPGPGGLWWSRAVKGSRARAANELGPFDGLLEGADGLVGSLVSSPLSPTSLESYASCPRRFMLSHVLNVRALDAPEDVLTMNARDRGSMIHEILHRFVGELVDGGKDGGVDQDRYEGDRDKEGGSEAGGAERLLELAESVFGEYVEKGATGKAALWEAEKDVARDQLVQIARIDSERRAEWVPVAVERSFGVGEEPVLQLRLPSGRSLSFRGYVDRVDRRMGGGGLTVLDYKTGPAETQGSLDEDPLVAGRRLQLAIYGWAMGERFGEQDVWSGYWFVSDRGRYQLTGYLVTDHVKKRLLEVLDVLTDSIADGLFPVRPGKRSRGAFENCTYCDYDRCCTTARDRSWEDQRSHPKLERYVSLVEG